MALFTAALAPIPPNVLDVEAAVGLPNRDPPVVPLPNPVVLLDERDPKLPPLCATAPNPPPNELPLALAFDVLLEVVDPNVPCAALLPKVKVLPWLPVDAAVPNVLGAPNPAPPNEVLGLLLAPKVDELTLEVPKVEGWPNPDPLLAAAPRLLTVPKPDDAPNFGVLLVVEAKGVVAVVVVEEAEPKEVLPKEVLPNDVFPNEEATGAALVVVGAAPNKDTGFVVSFVNPLVAALLANNELLVAGLLLLAFAPTLQLVP